MTWKRCIRCRGAGSIERAGGVVVCPYCKGEGEVRVYGSASEGRAPTDGRAGQQRKRTTD